jgi:hypothetical protein
VIAEYLDLLVQRAEVSRPAAEVSETGEITRVFDLVALSLPCRAYEGRGRTVRSDAGEQVTAAWTAVVAPDADVRHKDRLLIDGVSYDVALVSAVPDERGVHHLEITLERATAEPFR